MIIEWSGYGQTAGERQPTRGSSALGELQKDYTEQRFMTPREWRMSLPPSGSKARSLPRRSLVPLDDKLRTLVQFIERDDFRT